jgi:hypothetical protein
MIQDIMEHGRKSVNDDRLMSVRGNNAAITYCHANHSVQQGALHEMIAGLQ